jgi:hypothetical protein
LIDLQLTTPNDVRPGRLKLLDKAVASDIVRNNHSAFAFEAALAYNALGESAKALDWLERSESARSHSFNYLQVDPRIANLRDHPRFRRLAEKLRG